MASKKMINTAWKTNAFPIATPEYVDFALWKAGVERFKNPKMRHMTGSVMPHELDYLKGLHGIDSLTILRNFLVAELGTSSIQLTSIWLDKEALVVPYSGSLELETRELGDLAVVIRKQSATDQFISMWVLQAKKLNKTLGSLKTDDSTKKEIELLEGCPIFEFIRHDGTRVSFDLKKDFGLKPATYRHWSFLIMKADPKLYKALSNPMQWRWPGTKLAPLASGSFTDAILQQAKGMNFGAKVDGKNELPEWRRLWLELQSFGAEKSISGHSGGPIINNVGTILDALLIGEIHSFSLNSFPVFVRDPLSPIFDSFSLDLAMSNFHVTSTGFATNVHPEKFNSQAKHFQRWLEDEKSLSQNKPREDAWLQDGGGRNNPPGLTIDDGGRGFGGIKSMLVIDVMDRSG